MKKILLLLVLMLNVAFASKMYAVDGDQSHSGDWYYILVSDSWVRVTDCDPIVNANIPETLAGHPVQQITGYYPIFKPAVKPFQNRTTLVTCTIPKTVTLIEDGVFEGCTSLRAIMVDEANPNYRSVDSVLYTKDLTKILRIPYAKADDYTLPNTITEITSSLFEGCAALPEINIPASVVTIDVFAFADCAALTAINVDANNPNYCSIDGVLYNKDVTELIVCPRGKVGTCKVPNTVTKIGMYAFANCSLLTSVEMTGTVEEIGGLAFGGCTALQTMTCYAITPPTQSWFMPTFGLGSTYPKVDTTKCTLYVPIEGIEAYKADSHWNGFGHIEVIPHPSDFLGDGTAISPYRIFTANDWNLLATRVAQGNSYENIYFKQELDIAISTMVGDQTHPFCGDYNGNEHKLTFNANNVSENYAAPFRHVKGATIHSLVVDGSIATSAAYAGGLVSMADSALTVTNCRINTALSFSGTDVKSGGIVGCANGTVTMNGCLYDGDLTGSSTWTNFGGFVWSQAADSAVTISNSLFAPATFPGSGANIHPFVCGVNEAKTAFTYSYYIAPLTSTQGARAYTLTGATSKVTISRHDEPVFAYALTDTIYNAGVLYKGVLYYSAGAEIPLNLSGSYAYKPSVGNLVSHEDYYTLTTVAGNTIIYGSAAFNKNPSALNPEYTGSAQTLITAGTCTQGTPQYSLDSAAWSGELPQATDAGTYRVYYKIIGDATHTDSKVFSLDAPIAKAASSYITRPAAIANLYHTGSAQTLITAGEAAHGCTVTYSLDKKNWSAQLPSAIAVGIYYVYYRIEESANYKGLGPDSVIVPIRGTYIPESDNYFYDNITVLAKQEGSSTDSYQQAENLFDGRPGGIRSLKWCSFTDSVNAYSDRPKDIVVWKTHAPIEMLTYTLYTGDDTKTYHSRNWDSWTIYGGRFANDDAAAAALLTDDGWTIIDHRIQDTVLQAENDKGFKFACLNLGTYQYYRLVIHAIKGPGNTQQMAELTMGIRKEESQRIELLWTPKEEGERTDVLEKSLGLTWNTFNNMDHDNWGGTLSAWDDNLTGFNYKGSSPDNSVMGVASTYMCASEVPAYTTMTLTWAYRLYSKCTQHHSTVCLYAVPNVYDSIANLQVDFTNHYTDYSGTRYLLNHFTNENQNGKIYESAKKTASFSFNNIAGGTTQTKTWYLMMTYVMGSADGKTGLNESGAFKGISVDTTWTYRKIITFDANGGTGTMADQIIDNSGKLSPNTFVKDGYIFTCWSTEPNGSVVYPDQAIITATANDKGPKTLYAVWTEWGHGTPEGPWTQLEWKSGTSVKSENSSIAYNQLDNTQWPGTITSWRDNDGIGFSYKGTSPDESKMGIFSTYQKEVVAPAYSCLTLKWTYQLSSKSTKHHSNTCLYALQDYNQLKALAVDFTNHYDNKAGKNYLLATPFQNRYQNGKIVSDMQSHTFTFDNRDGNAPQTKAWYLMLTHVVASADGRSGLKEWGAFKHRAVDSVWIYRKIVTFNANGGTGTMADQIVDNSGKLSHNTFTKANHYFAGWALSANGPVVYDDGEVMTATAQDKGPVTLYAVWEEGSDDAPTLKGLWTHVGRSNFECDRMKYPSLSYNELDGSKWGGLDSWGIKGDSTGYDFEGGSPDISKNAIFSIYRKDTVVPSYTCMKMAWRFRLGSKSKKHHSTVCMYGLPDSLNQIKNLKVDFSDDYVTTVGSEYLLTAPFSHSNQDGKTRYADQAYTFVFDNSAGSVEQTKTWFMMFTYVLASSGGKDNLNERGYYRSLRVKYISIYYKAFSFNANGGSGIMEQALVENGGNLPANTFTREGYTFAGWALSADGAVEYADEAAITATAETKGAYTLYAVWTPDTYTISYDLDGGEATNPASYTEATETFTLTNPTQDGYTFLGWTGSNGDVPQASVSIVKGSTGAKSYTARWMSNEVTNTQNLITAIGEVTIDKGEDIADARAAYNELSEEDKALVSNYTTLTAAEAAYEAARDAAGNTTINFVDKDEESLGSQKIALDYPDAPVIAGYIFDHWQIVAKDLPDGTIRLQAVYISDPTGIEDGQRTMDNGQWQKFIKDGNLYILKDEFIYTINGQRVNK